MNKHLYSDLKIKDNNDAERTITHYVSTVNVDSYNEVLIPKGFDESKFKAVLWQHGRGRNLLTDKTPKPSELVIGKKLWLRHDEVGVFGKTEFAETTLGKDVYLFNKLGYINSWSVGWLEKAQAIISKGMKDGKEVEIKTFEEWYIYEYSSVIFPANSESVNIELMMKEAKDDYLVTVLNEEKMFSDMDIRMKFFDSELKKVQEYSTLLEEIKTGNKFASASDVQDIKNTLQELSIKLNGLVQSREIVANNNIASRKLSNEDINKLADEIGRGAIRKLTGRNV